MPHKPLNTLNTVFGFSAFRPFQEQIVDTVIAGHDAFVLMPTGGGKSLCFQIPALHRAGVAIVVSPLISLMKDQVDALLANGVRAACYNSSQLSELLSLHLTFFDVMVCLVTFFPTLLLIHAQLAAFEHFPPC